MATPILGATISPTLEQPIQWKTRDSITWYKNKRDFKSPSWLLVFWVGQEDGFDGVIIKSFLVQSTVSLRHNVFEGISLQECMNKAKEWNLNEVIDLSSIPRPNTLEVPFEPGLIDTSIWFDASEITAGAKSSWIDKSGNDYELTQSTASQQPVGVTNVINGFSALRGDNTVSMEAIINISAVQDFHVFYVMSKEGSDCAYEFSASTPLALRLLDNGTAVGRQRGGSAAFPGVSAGTTGSFAIFYSKTLISPVGPDLEFTRYENGDTTPISEVTISAPEFEAGDIFTEFYMFDDKTGNNTSTGDIVELIVVNTENYRDKIMGYLAHKYNLPVVSGHPYEIDPPTIIVEI